MIMRYLILFIIFVFQAKNMLWAQSTAYVIHAGPSFGTQRWDNGSDRQIMYGRHLAIAFETLDDAENKSALLAQFGYHVKGSATRFNVVNANGGIFNTFSESFRYNIISSLFAAKQKYQLGQNENNRYFYYGGLRVDYVLSNNVDDLAARNPFLAIYYPQVGALNRWTFGVSVGGGMEFMFRELIGGQLTFTLAPDLTNLYNQPPITNVRDPWGGPGQNITISQRRIRNTTLELSLAVRLIKKVEIVD